MPNTNYSFKIVSPEPVILPMPPVTWMINGTSNDPLIKILDNSTHIGLQAYWNQIVYEANITSFANKVLNHNDNNQF